MINVCQHPLSARVNVYLNHKTIEQCAKCSVAVRLVEEPVEIPQTGGWLPFAKTVLPNGHTFYQKILVKEPRKGFTKIECRACFDEEGSYACVAQPIGLNQPWRACGLNLTIYLLDLVDSTMTSNI